MKRIFAALALAAVAAGASAQVGGVPGPSGSGASLLYKSSDPSGTCAARTFLWQTTSNSLWICEAGVWVEASAAGPTFPISGTAGCGVGQTAYTFTDSPGSGLCLSGGVGSEQLNLVGNLRLDVNVLGTVQYRFDNGFLTLATGNQVAWGSSGAASAPDVGLARGASGLLLVTNGAGGNGIVRVGDGSNAAPGFSFTNGGGVGMRLVGTTSLRIIAPGDIGISTQGGGDVETLGISGSAVRMGAAGQFSWTSGAGGLSGGSDTGLARSSAGVVKFTDGSSGFGSANALRYYAQSGAANAPVYTFVDDVAVGFWLNGSGNLVASSANTAQWQLNGTAMRMKDGLQINWASGDPTLTGADTGLARNGAAEVRVTDGTSGTGTLVTRVPVFANTGTLGITVASSGYIITNTGDGDGSVINLPNDPTLGTEYEFAITAAQAVTINAASGETIQHGATSGTTTTASAIGSVIRLVAVTGGSGAIWMVMSTQLTWVTT